MKSVFAFIFIFFAVTHSFGFELRTAAQDSAPKYYEENGVMKGLCVDIINELVAEVPELQIKGYDNFLPFKRLQRYLENGDIDIFVGLKKTQDREAKYNFVPIPIYTVNYFLIARSDDDFVFTDNTKLSDFSKDDSILTVFGSAAERFLSKENCSNILPIAKNPENLIQMLLYKRGRFAFYHNLGIEAGLKKNNAYSKVKVIPLRFYTYSHYIALSKKVSPSIANKIELAVRKMQSNGFLAKTYSKYVNFVVCKYGDQDTLQSFFHSQHICLSPICECLY